MKRSMTTLLLCCMCVVILLGTASCVQSGPAPAPEDVYDRIVTVVEASHEVNVLLFGAGLPVYPRGTAEDELIHRYYGVNDDGREFVTPYTKYVTLSDMERAISAVYSTEYRESLFETLFTGYADSQMTVAMPARFHEDEKAMYQSRYVEALVKGVRIYDYASMEIMKGSTSTYMRVAIPSYTESHPNEWKTVYLAFVYENGDWYLDSPSC